MRIAAADERGGKAIDTIAALLNFKKPLLVMITWTRLSPRVLLLQEGGIEGEICIGEADNRRFPLPP
jgi:hypothetical protein